MLPSGQGVTVSSPVMAQSCYVVHVPGLGQMVSAALQEPFESQRRTRSSLTQVESFGSHNVHVNPQSLPAHGS